jgi:protein tyrosine phosphatase
LSEDKLLEGIIVSGMFLERYGVEMLKKYFVSKGIDVKPLKIDEMKVSQVMSMLLGYSLITNKTHCKISEVLRERNRIIHKVMYPDLIDKDKVRDTIQKAIECLKDLNVIL